MSGQDKYKDPTNDKILKEISEKIKWAKKHKVFSDEYRVGLYAGMNIALKNLGREPL